jgi:hypothetical protein
LTITPFDDYPIHQTPLPVAHPATGDPNHYDRYWFNGFDADVPYYFGIAMGVYPNRKVIDAAFSVVHGGVQRSVFASGRAPMDRGVTKIGPISIEVVEPLRVNRVVVDAAHLGITASLTWEPRTAAIEEPRQTMQQGTTTIMDVTRLVQWGSWRGTIDTAGERLDINTRGMKDRSWGIRPVGLPVPGAPPEGIAGGGFFMIWAPTHFERDCTHLILFEGPDGKRISWSGARIPVLGPGDPVWGVEAEHAISVDHRVDFQPGTRRARRATLGLDFGDGSRDELSLDPVLRFHMKGIGYFHQQWAHGVWRGEAAEGADEWKLDDLDPLDPTNFHVQQVMRVRRGNEEGVGVMEQVILGAHYPSGLTGYTDGARG